MKKQFILLIALFALMSCKKEKEPVVNNYIVNSSMLFSLVNSQNEDLLDPNTPNAIDVSKIRVFYVENNETKLYFDGNMDAPFGYKLNTEQGNRIVVFFNNSKMEERPITYIQWRENDRDKIEVQYIKNIPSILKEKVWLNGKLIWQEQDVQTKNYYTIVKD